MIDLPHFASPSSRFLPADSRRGGAVPIDSVCVARAAGRNPGSVPIPESSFIMTRDAVSGSAKALDVRGGSVMPLEGRSSGNMRPRDFDEHRYGLVGRGGRYGGAEPTKNYELFGALGNRKSR